MTYIIAEPCIGEKDASCVAVCPVDCIYEAENQYFIHPDECIDCGACEPECPVTAIFPTPRCLSNGRRTSKATCSTSTDTLRAPALVDPQVRVGGGPKAAD